MKKSNNDDYPYNSSYNSYAVKFPPNSQYIQWDDQRKIMKELGVVYSFATGREWHIKCSPEVLTVLILKLDISVGLFRPFLYHNDKQTSSSH